MSAPQPQSFRQAIIRRHLCVGWCCLAAFVAFGAVLDSLHAFKIGQYLDPTADTPRALLDADAYFNLRRFLWMLCHRHGTGLALIHIAFAYLLRLETLPLTAGIRLAGKFLTNAILLIPAGFFLGGFKPSESDPSRAIWLVPVGAFFLLTGLALIAHQVVFAKPAGGGA